MHKLRIIFVLIALAVISPPHVHAQTEKFILVVNKTAHEMKLYKDVVDDAHWQASYPVTLGTGGLADKQKSGDNLVPEGTYHIIAKLDLSTRPKLYNWNKALVLDYPNAEDIKKHKTGGGIWIHGFQPSEHDAYEQTTINQGIGWSQGCVVLRNPEVDELFAIIAPFSPGKLVQTQNGPALRTEIPKDIQPTVIINH